jgi:hypothetical protein
MKFLNRSVCGFAGSMQARGMGLVLVNTSRVGGLPGLDAPV